jgi:broad specificity phosphatase PhoE
MKAMRSGTSIEIPISREAVWKVLVAAKRIRLGGVNVLTHWAITNPPGSGGGSVNPHPEDDALEATRSATPSRSYPARPNPSRAGGVMQQAHPIQVVHLVRHGRTAWNAQRRVMGWLDEGVEPVARRDAEAVADALADEAVAAIVSSPLRRALQTAGALANRVGIEPRVDDRIGELRMGPWEGLTEDEIAERWPEEWRRWQTKPHTLALEGRETLGKLNARVAAVLDELTCSSVASGAAVVFTHDAVVRAAVAWAFGTGPEVYRHVEVANCSITTVRVVDGVRRLVRANQVGHLERRGREGC